MEKTGLVATAAVCAAMAVLALRVGNGVETDLYRLAGDGDGGALQEIAAGLAGQGRVLVEGPASHPPVELAAAVEVELGRQGQNAGSFADTLACLAKHKDGLLAPETRELLRKGQYGDVAADALARLYGFTLPLFSVKDDPFMLATGYALSLQSRLAGGWTFKEGYPTCERDGRSCMLVAVDLSGIPATRLATFLMRAESFNAGHADFGRTAGEMSAGLKIWCGGPPFHAARTSEIARSEINALSVLSIVAVLAMGWLLLRSFRFVLPLMTALGVAALFACAALFAVFPRPHVLTFVFGTSLIGLSVDYVYHACAAGGARRVGRPLACAMLTTVAAFTPLLFAAVDVLRQMALFSIAGLVAMWAWTMVFLRTAAPVPARRFLVAGHISQRWKMAAAGILLMLALPGVTRLEIVHDPASFYRPCSYLAASEKRIAELNPAGTGKFVYVRGATLQRALEREEEAGVKGLSAVIPSLRRQKENRALVAELYEREGHGFTSKTGLPMPQLPVEGEEGLLNPELVEDARLRRMIHAAWTGKGLVSPCPESFVPQGPDMLVLEPRQALADMFGRFTGTTLNLLGFSLVALAALLAVLFRRRFLKFSLPVMAALAATAGTLGWLGVPVTFFTLLCAFVLTGLGIDYAIFHGARLETGKGESAEACTHGEVTAHAVSCSFLTSFIGLGALAFTDFAVTRMMGVAFAVGLFYSFLFAGSICKAECTCPGEKVEAWYDQKEQSAGGWRIWFLWQVYRWFGKGLQKALCVPVVMFIMPFARPARQALREFYSVLEDYRKTAVGGFQRTAGYRPMGISRFPFSAFRLFRHLLGFAWSLADKTDACTLKKALPQMSVREDDGWHAFDALTSSGKGAFLIAAHLGTIEVLPALPVALGRQTGQPRLHAFQQMGHDTEFMKVFMRHLDTSRLTLHAVEEIGVDTAVAMQEAIGRGELVLMAGDRVSAGSGKVLHHGFLGRDCIWPKGVFVFARLMEAPVFFVTCLRTGWNSYEVHFEKGGRDLLDAYVRFLEKETLSRPDQWYQFYKFFSQRKH